MTLHPRFIPDVPEETVRVAKAAFRKGHRYMQMRDELGAIYSDEQFADLFPKVGRLAEAPWRLALVTIMQFVENLTDRQAADAVRSRIDWKYALSLELSDAGFDFSVLSEFRGRLLTHGAENRLFELMLSQFEADGLLKTGKQRTDSTHTVTNVRELNRLEFVGETLRAALNAVADTAPEWLKPRILPDWVQRYSRPFSDWRLPQKEQERHALGEQIGRDGMDLLTQVYASDSPAHLRQLPEVEFLRRAWVYQYYQEDDQTRWRGSGNLPPGSSILKSPYDPDVRRGKKSHSGTGWSGFRVQLTETCDASAPYLVTHVDTTLAPSSDFEGLPKVHQDLSKRGRLPKHHLVDSGFLSGDILVQSWENYGVDVVGPLRVNYSWQAKAQQGYDSAHFLVDVTRQTVTCPQGKTSQGWSPGLNGRGKAVVRIRFAPKDCQPCPVRQLCTRAKQRQLIIPNDPAYLASLHARQREQSDEFKVLYSQRAGIEGTISQAANSLAMRKTRYHGLAKVHLQNVMTAAALNLLRVLDWLSEKPRSKTRVSTFTRLAVA